MRCTVPDDPRNVGRASKGALRPWNCLCFNTDVPQGSLPTDWGIQDGDYFWSFASTVIKYIMLQYLTLKFKRQVHTLIVTILLEDRQYNDILRLSTLDLNFFSGPGLNSNPRVAACSHHLPATAAPGGTSSGIHSFGL